MSRLCSCRRMKRSAISSNPELAKSPLAAEGLKSAAILYRRGSGIRRSTAAGAAGCPMTRPTNLLGQPWASPLAPGPESASTQLPRRGGHCGRQGPIQQPRDHAAARLRAGEYQIVPTRCRAVEKVHARRSIPSWPHRHLERSSRPKTKTIPSPPSRAVGKPCHQRRQKRPRRMLLHMGRALQVPAPPPIRRAGVPAAG